ncbi:MAG TPA: type I methionyl aminopeptidase [Thermoleophilia bacterium]|nr:type I methionyl aminopeptidase [Thermoleophilia bacterium]
MIVRKSNSEIAKIAAAGAVVAECLDLLATAVRPGVTTLELDRLAERYILERGGTPTFKGYRGFPSSICASPNEMVVHGIPGAYTVGAGDVLSIDVGVTMAGYVADSALTVAVGEVGDEAVRLLAVTAESLEVAIEQCRVGRRLGDISHAVQEMVEAAGFSVVRSLVGHGVGRVMHEEPQIPNYGDPGRGPRLEAGMVFAIEPMVNAGTWDVYVGDDAWSIYSADHSLSAHFEHTVAITARGPRVLTRRRSESAGERCAAGAGG